MGIARVGAAIPQCLHASAPRPEPRSRMHSGDGIYRRPGVPSAPSRYRALPPGGRPPLSSSQQDFLPAPGSLLGGADRRASRSSLPVGSSPQAFSSCWSSHATPDPRASPRVDRRVEVVRPRLRLRALHFDPPRQPPSCRSTAPPTTASPPALPPPGLNPAEFRCRIKSRAARLRRRPLLHRLSVNSDWCDNHRWSRDG